MATRFAFPFAAPGDDAALCRLMGRVMSQPLDRERPLWETWLVEGLEEGRWALLFKVHHCMVDGISAVEITTSACATRLATSIFCRSSQLGGIGRA